MSNVSLNTVAVTVNFESATYQVLENNGSVFVCVMKDGEMEDSFSVEVTSIPQTAQGMYSDRRRISPQCTVMENMHYCPITIVFSPS